MGTEDVNYRTKNIDQLSVKQIVETIHLEDIRAYEAIGCILDDTAEVVKNLLDRIELGGRVIYVGAGTSGRIAAQDVIELLPTYGIGDETFIYFIAGGDEALKMSKEGAEDNEKEIEEKLKEIKLDNMDSIVGISASGNTPYVLSAIRYGNEIGALTIGITNNPGSLITSVAKKVLILNTGPEVIQGSTRMKSGTSQKMLLNIISTTIAIKMGRVEGNMMTHMKANFNQKLRKRAINILVNRYGLKEEEAKKLLESVSYDIQKAISIVSGGNSKYSVN